MAMMIQHNIQSMFSARQLGITSGNKAKSQEKLASGYKINRAADNAAGLSISEKMRKKIRGLDRGAKNIQDGISLAQVADGALTETHDILQRMNELTIQAANGTNSESDRHAIQQEINQLKIEIDRISDTTNFNQTVFPLRDGEYVDNLHEAAVTTTIPGDAVKFDNLSFDFDYSDVTFDARPFNENTPLSSISLFTQVQGTGTAADGKFYSILYTGDESISSSQVLNGNAGRTSYPCVLYNYEGATNAPKKASFSEFEYVSSNLDNNAKKWSRTFSYTEKDAGGNPTGVSFNITQTISLDEENKKYQIDTELTNTGSKELKQSAIVMNLDTSYKGGWEGDHSEGYYLDTTGPQVSKQSLYTDPLTATDLATANSLGSNNGITNTYNNIILDTIQSDGNLPSSFIVGGKDKDGDSDGWMPFAVKVDMNKTQSIHGGTTVMKNYGITDIQTSGIPVNTNIVNYEFSANSNKITITGKNGAGVVVGTKDFKYEDIQMANGKSLADYSVEGGDYSLNYNGVKFTLKAEGGSTINDIKKSIGGAKVNINGAYNNNNIVSGFSILYIKGDKETFKSGYPYTMTLTDDNKISIGEWKSDTIDWNALLDQFNNDLVRDKVWDEYEQYYESRSLNLALGQCYSASFDGGFDCIFSEMYVFKTTDDEVGIEDLKAIFDGGYSYPDEGLRDIQNFLDYHINSDPKVIGEGSEGTSSVSGLTQVKREIIEGGTLSDDSTDGNFLVLGRYGSDKIDFVSNYGGAGTGGNIYGQDHCFSYGTFGKKNSISIGIIDVNSMKKSDGSPVVSGDIKVTTKKMISDHHHGKSLKIQNSDEGSDWTAVHTVNASCKGIGVQDVSVLTADLATNSIDMITAGIKKVSEYRSYFGAMQNRFEHARAINLNSGENTTAAESRIRDTDIAKEVARHSKESILEQAGQSVLAQANQSTNGALSLLQG